jgi:hypothetical protein
MTGATGLEPAASCVTGRRSNQLELRAALKTIPYNYRMFLRLPLGSRNFLKNAVTANNLVVTN